LDQVIQNSEGFWPKRNLVALKEEASPIQVKIIAVKSQPLCRLLWRRRSAAHRHRRRVSLDWRVMPFIRASGQPLLRKWAQSLVDLNESACKGPSERGMTMRLVARLEWVIDAPHGNGALPGPEPGGLGSKRIFPEPG
jgi:hypothetical protein